MPNSVSRRNQRKLVSRFLKQNKLAEARVQLKGICERDRNDIDSWIELATLERKLNNLHAAESCCMHVLRIRNNHPDALHTLASVKHKAGDLTSAIRLYNAALHTDRTREETRYYLANAYRESGSTDKAIQCYESLLESNPDHLEALNNLSALYTSLGKISQSLALLDRASVIRPNNSNILNNLGRAFLNMGDAAAASEIFGKLVKQREVPDSIISNYLMCLNYLDNIDPVSIESEHSRLGKLITDRAEAFRRVAVKPGKTVKIGIISPDFVDHPVSRFISPFIKNHDRHTFCVHCYSDSANYDDISASLSKHCHKWHNTRGMDDTATGRLIIDDGIDILIELAGHTAGNRMSLLAKKPAPLQLSYIGYPNITGLQSIDYRLCDAVTDPVRKSADKGTVCAPSERVEWPLRLPGCFLCYEPDMPNAVVNANRDFSSSPLMFGSFNNLAKTTEQTIEIWCRILQAIPDSSLSLKSRATSDHGVRDRLLNIFRKYGVGMDRLVFLDTKPSKAEHYQCYNDIDIALDTFPYNGTTTTFEAIWMGVPVITLSGQSHVSRVGTSILINLSLDRLVAATTDQYVSIAQELHRNRDELAEYHRSLRDRLSGSSLMDQNTHTRNLESILSDILNQHTRQTVS